MKKILWFSIIAILFSCFNNSIFATLSTPVLTSPANNATNVPLPVTFLWNNVSGATYYRLQVYIGINVIIDTTNIAGTQITISSLLGQTQYRWRVKAYNSNDSSAFSAYFTFTTAVAAPPVPLLLAPPNGTSGVSVTPLIDWSDVPNAQTYRLQLGTDQNFNTTTIDIPGLTSSQYQITGGSPLSNGTAYYWRVNASNTGGTSQWSTVWNFSTIAAPPPAPTLFNPANGATNISLTPNMTWSNVNGATSYHLQIATNGSFNNSIIYDSTSIPATQLMLPSGILGGPFTYYWRVSSINAGGEGGFSVVFHFTTVTGPPPPPILLVPVIGATCVSRFPLLDWQDTPGATGYRIQISTDASYTNLVVNTTTTASQYQVTGNVLLNNTMYYWHVSASNAGGPGPYSTTWTFTTLPVNPLAPVLLTPANNATGVSLTPSLVWQRGANATAYRLQVSYTSTFNNGTIVVDQQNLSDTTYNVPAGTLNGNQTYYWRVSSSNCAATSTYSTVFHFTTLQTISVNLKVLLEGFYNGSEQVPDTVRMYLAQATGSHLKIDSSKVALSSTGSNTTSFTHAPNGSYYLVVIHRNHLETWSSLPVALSTGNTVNYDFSTAPNKAYGNNMKQVGSVWVFYGGDINQDGTIDPDDYTLFKTQYGRDGYIPSDLNGDTFADGYDLLILYSNFFISKITP
jgi:hypothetical protein